MRILLWSETFYPRIGGVEVMGMEFVRALAARGHELIIIAGPYLENSEEPQSFYGIPLYRFPFEYEIHPYSMEMVVRVKKKLTELRQHFRPDLFHLYQTSQGFFFFNALSKSLARAGSAPNAVPMNTPPMNTVPTLLTLHSLYFNTTPPVNAARRQLCQQVDWISACSQAVLDDTRAALPAITPHSSTIYNALSMPALEPTALDFEQPRLLYVGRLHSVKRADLAIAAFAHVHSRFAQARLTIAGNGEEEANLRAQVAHLGLQAAVDFLGWVSPQAVPALINQATMLLVPSDAEAFGLSALQGGQMARPVIATRVGGLPEVIIDGETGLLVEPNNAEAMAAAIATLLTDPERARALGLAARQFVQRFSLTTFVEAYESLYRHLIERGLSANGLSATSQERS